MNWLIDDGHLARYLRTGKMPIKVRANDDVYTTGYWYVRLCQAMLGVARRGSLSASFDRLTAEQYDRVLAAVVELPDEIGLVSLRELAPVIGRLRREHELNVLSSEALAAASTLRAHVALSAPSPRLEAALRAEGLRVTRDERRTR